MKMNLRRPKVAPEEYLKALVKADPFQILRENAEKLDVGKSTVAIGPKRIGKVKKVDKWVPHNLSDRRELARLEVPFTAFAQ